MVILMKRKRPVVRIATPRTYELIGRVAAGAAELEFVLIFCAKLADKDDMIRVEEALGSRKELFSLAQRAFRNLQIEREIPALASYTKHLRKVKKIVAKRDALVHGLLMTDENQELKMYQPRKDRYVSIDDESLEAILKEMQVVSDSLLELRKVIWTELHQDKLIQLGSDTPGNRGIGTRLQ